MGVDCIFVATLHPEHKEKDLRDKFAFILSLPSPIFPGVKSSCSNINVNSNIWDIQNYKYVYCFIDWNYLKEGFLVVHSGCRLRSNKEHQTNMICFLNTLLGIKDTYVIGDNEGKFEKFPLTFV